MEISGEYDTDDHRKYIKNEFILYFYLTNNNTDRIIRMYSTEVLMSIKTQIINLANKLAINVDLTDLTGEELQWLYNDLGEEEMALYRDTCHYYGVDSLGPDDEAGLNDNEEETINMSEADLKDIGFRELSAEEKAEILKRL